MNQITPEDLSQVSLADFIRENIGPDQTELVEYLLEFDFDGRIVEDKHLHNYAYFTAYLREGVLKGTVTTITEKMISIEDEIEGLQCRYNKLRRTTLGTSTHLRTLLEQMDQFTLGNCSVINFTYLSAVALKTTTAAI